MGCSASAPAAEPEYLENFHGHYKLGRKLGDGAFGQVRAAVDRSTGAERAVKVVDARLRDKLGGCTGEVDRKRLRLARNEASVWRELGRHQHCVKLVGVFFEQSVYYMAMDRCHCTLMDGLAGMTLTTEADLGRIFREMLLGICHVHEVGLVHRDIKPDNFLFGGSTASTVMLCDFGLTARMPKVGLLKGVYGTVPYMSPEMLAGTGYDQRTDVWSLGATVHQILYGCHPYTPSQKSMDAVKKAIVADCPKLAFPDMWNQWGKSGRLPKPAVSFLRLLLQRPLAARCSSQQALKHSFLQPAAATEATQSSFAHAPTSRVAHLDMHGCEDSHTRELLRHARESLSAPLCLSASDGDPQGDTMESTRTDVSYWVSERPSLGTPSPTTSPTSPTPSPI